MDECIFCKIAAGDIPAEKVFEDERFVAFLDIHPVSPRHTLLIPKQHFRWFYEIPDDLSDGLFRTAKKVARTLKEETGSDYIKLGIVGTDIPHVHVHLIPRRIADGPVRP
ncbi:HIT domain-containing protein [Patescibacteria group bacterium]|nr:HIT domain-containing protein [Patescibacteria group bacterium]